MEQSEPQFAQYSVGLGTFPFSNVFSKVSHGEAEAIVGTFLDAGGFYIETAPIYPASEVDLGAILANYDRSSYLVGTKCAYVPGVDGDPVLTGNKEAIQGHVFRELERLGLDYLDIVATHLTPTDTPLAEVAHTLENLRESGLVRYIGASNVNKDEIKQYAQGGDIDLIQNRYSILHRCDVDPIVEVCRENGIYLNPYQVIERGQLLLAGANRRAKDLRNMKSEYVGNADNYVRQWVKDVLSPIAKEAELSLAELVIRWCYNSDHVTLPVIGATTEEQVERTMAITKQPLASDVYVQIESAFSKFETTIENVFTLSVPDFRGLA